MSSINFANRFALLAENSEPVKKYIPKQTFNEKRVESQYNTRFDALKSFETSNPFEKKQYEDKSYNQRRNERYNRNAMPRRNEPQVVKKPEFNLTETKLINEFPSLSNKKVEELKLVTTYTDKVKIEKKVVEEKKYIKPSDVRSIVNEYYINKIPLQERRYDSNGWMENEDWIEWYEENKFHLDNQMDI